MINMWYFTFGTLHWKKIKKTWELLFLLRKRVGAFRTLWKPKTLCSLSFPCKMISVWSSKRHLLRIFCRTSQIGRLAMGLNRHSAEIETQTTQRPGQEGTGVDPQPTSRHSVIEWLCKCPSSSPDVLIGFNNLLIASIPCNPIVDPCENVQHLGSLSTRGVDNGRGCLVRHDRHVPLWI